MRTSDLNLNWSPARQDPFQVLRHPSGVAFPWDFRLCLRYFQRCNHWAVARPSVQSPTWWKWRMWKYVEWFGSDSHVTCGNLALHLCGKCFPSPSRSSDLCRASSPSDQTGAWWDWLIVVKEHLHTCWQGPSSHRLGRWGAWNTQRHFWPQFFSTSRAEIGWNDEKNWRIGSTCLGELVDSGCLLSSLQSCDIQNFSVDCAWDFWSLWACIAITHLFNSRPDSHQSYACL